MKAKNFGSKIIQLRSEGKTYREIKRILNCAMSTICYHCGKEQKNKSIERARSNIHNKLQKSSSRFKLRNSAGDKMRGSIVHFKESGDLSPLGYKDVLHKFGVDTKCYLTGDPINLEKDDYHFDHILPISKGGKNAIDNLGITTPIANMSKQDMTIEEYIEHCKKVLINFGYKINI